MRAGTFFGLSAVGVCLFVSGLLWILMPDENLLYKGLVVGFGLGLAGACVSFWGMLWK